MLGNFFRLFTMILSLIFLFYSCLAASLPMVVDIFLDSLVRNSSTL